MPGATCRPKPPTRTAPDRAIRGAAQRGTRPRQASSLNDRLALDTVIAADVIIPHDEENQETLPEEWSADMNRTCATLPKKKKHGNSTGTDDSANKSGITTRAWLRTYWAGARVHEDRNGSALPFLQPNQYFLVGLAHVDGLEGVEHNKRGHRWRKL